MRRIVYSFVLFTLLSLPPLFAIHPNVRNFSYKLSKSGTQNWDIVQHQNGWVYFANNLGLLEYDGNRWSVYPIGNYTNVRSIYYEQAQDRIYAGAFNEFGYYARNRSGVLQYHSMIDQLPAKDRSFKEIWNIHKIENTLFFQGDNEIFRSRGHQTQRFSFPDKIDCSAVVHNSLLVSGTNSGVWMFNGNMFIKLPNADLLKGKKICAILPFQKSKILFVSEFSGLYLFDGESVTSLKTDLDQFMTENQVFCATIEGSKLALGTVRNGLVVKDFANNTNVFSNTFSGLQNNTILSIAFDRHHNLWLGLDKGIDYVLVNSPVYDLFGNSQLYGSGYSSIIKNQHLYLGTNQGLYVTGWPVVSSPMPISLKLVPKMQGQVWSLRMIDNTLFCGSDHGAFIITDQGAEQIATVQGTWTFRELRHHPGYILGCSYQGFFILKKVGQKWQFSNFVSGFNETGGMFEEDEQGDIWFCHWIKGITRLTLNADLTAFSKREAYGPGRGIPSDRDNTLYKIGQKLVFTTQRGFYGYDPISNRIVKNSFLQSIFGNPNHSMKLSESPSGEIWCTSYSYIGRAVKQPNGKYGVDSTSCSVLKSKLISGFEHLNFVTDNHVIVSTEDGFAWVTPSTIKPEKGLLSVSIRNVYLTNQNDSIVSGYQSSQNNEIPQFDYEQNSVRFEYVAPEYRNEAAVVYSYLLENYDTKWSSYSSANSKEYSKLRKGAYTFRVRAKSLLNSNVVETRYQFVVLPPWYESKVAYGFYLILLLCLIYALFRFVKIRSEKGAREMEAQKELELQEQEKRFEEDAKAKRKEIIELKNQRLQYDLRHKSQELANSTMNLIRKNEILLEITQNLNKIAASVNETADSRQVMKHIHKMQEQIRQNIEYDNNWKRFAENFDLVYENYLKRLSEQYPKLTISDKKLCAYLKMDLSSKDIAPLLNMSFRSVEMSRYRLRKKMGLERDVNLSEFLQRF